jgi:hypothetical protein
MGSRSKKLAYASDQDRPDVLRKREAWFTGQLDLDPERLVFIDETWASTNIARRHGRCHRGQRLRVGIPGSRRRPRASALRSPSKAAAALS